MMNIIKKILRESDEWGWVKTTNPSFEIGDEFVVKGQNSTPYGNTVFRIESIDGNIVTISWDGEEFDPTSNSIHTKRVNVKYNLDDVNKWVNKDIGDRWELVRESKDDDFDWIANINPLSHIFNGRVFIENDIDELFMETIQQEMFKYGYRWAVNKQNVLVPNHEDHFVALTTLHDGVYTLGFFSNKTGSYSEHRDVAKKQNRYYLASQIMTLINNKINESEEDDFDWIRDTNPRKVEVPFVVTFTREEIDNKERLSKTMDFLLKTCECGWPTIDNMVHLRSTMRNGSNVIMLYIEENLYHKGVKNITWCEDGDPLCNQDLTDYSRVYTMTDLFNELQNGSLISESDDFDWIRDTNLSPYNNIKFYHIDQPELIYTIHDDGSDKLYVSWGVGHRVYYPRKEIEQQLNTQDYWIPI